MRIKKFRRIVIICIVVISAGYLIVREMNLRISTKEIDIQGLVTSVKYNKKGFPVIRVNDNEFYSLSFANNDSIKVGDSIIKIKGKKNTSIIKKDGSEQIYDGVIVKY